MDEQANEPTQFTLDIPAVEITFDARDIVQRVTPSDLVNLIIEMDGEAGEWEVTLLLYHYFKGQLDLAVSTGAVPHLLALDEQGLWDLLAQQEAEQAEIDAKGAGQ